MMLAQLTFLLFAEEASARCAGGAPYESPSGLPMWDCSPPPGSSVGCSLGWTDNGDCELCGCEPSWLGRIGGQSTRPRPSRPPPSGRDEYDEYYGPDEYEPEPEPEEDNGDKFWCDKLFPEDPWWDRRNCDRFYPSSSQGQDVYDDYYDDYQGQGVNVAGPPAARGVGGMSSGDAKTATSGDGLKLHGFEFYPAPAPKPSSVGGMSIANNPCLMRNTCDYCTDHEGYLGKCTSGYCEARHEYQDVACGGMGPQGPWTGTAFEAIGGMSQDAVGGMSIANNPCLMRNTCDYCTDHEGFLGKCTSSGYCEARHEYQDVACGGMGPQGPWTGTAFEGIGGMSQDAVGGMSQDAVGGMRRPWRPMHDQPCSITIYDRYYYKGNSRTFYTSHDSVHFTDPSTSAIVKGDGCKAWLDVPTVNGIESIPLGEGGMDSLSISSDNVGRASTTGTISIRLERDGRRIGGMSSGSSDIGGMSSGSSGIGGMSPGYGGMVYCAAQLTKQECQYHGCTETSCPCMWQDNYNHYGMNKGTGYCMKSKYTFSG